MWQKNAKNNVIADNKKFFILIFKLFSLIFIPNNVKSHHERGTRSPTSLITQSGKLKKHPENNVYYAELSVNIAKMFVSF